MNVRRRDEGRDLFDELHWRQLDLVGAIVPTSRRLLYRLHVRRQRQLELVNHAFIHRVPILNVEPPRSLGGDPLQGRRHVLVDVHEFAGPRSGEEIDDRPVRLYEIHH